MSNRITRKELEEKFQVWAEVAGFNTDHTNGQHYLELEHRNVGIYGPNCWRILAVNPVHGGINTMFGDTYLTTKELVAALNLAINTVYQFGRRPELRKRAD